MLTYNLINSTITENYTSGVYDLNFSKRGITAGTLLFQFSDITGTKDATINVYVTNDESESPVWFLGGTGSITALDTDLEFTITKPYTKFKYTIILNSVTECTVKGFSAFNTESRYD